MSWHDPRDRRARSPRSSPTSARYSTACSRMAAWWPVSPPNCERFSIDLLSSRYGSAPKTNQPRAMPKLASTTSMTAALCTRPVVPGRCAGYLAFPFALGLGSLSIRTRCAHGLTGLSVRWMQPAQQHGRRFPSSSSSRIRSMRRFLVSSCLASSTQHRNSLRPRAVRACHRSRAGLSDNNALRRSAGISCTTPAAIASLVMKVEPL